MAVAQTAAPQDGFRATRRVLESRAAAYKNGLGEPIALSLVNTQSWQKKRYCDSFEAHSTPLAREHAPSHRLLPLGYSSNECQASPTTICELVSNQRPLCVEKLVSNSLRLSLHESMLSYHLHFSRRLGQILSWSRVSG